jgi:hypothetical protein
MDLYEKLEDQQRAWSVCEVAHFLGYNPKYVYELIRENKIEGWFEVNGTYKFCPVKLKAWMEKKFGRHGHKGPESNGSSNGKPGREDEAAS